MSDHTIVRASEAPDPAGQAPGAFPGYGRRLSVRFEEHRSEAVGHDHFWPAA